MVDRSAKSIFQRCPDYTQDKFKTIFELKYYCRNTNTFPVSVTALAR